MKRKKRPIFTHAELKEWSYAVKSRDNYTCQECFGSNMKKRLCAHHIKPKETFPELAFDVDNGLTLCNPCHSRLHNIGNQHSLGYIHTAKQNEAIGKSKLGNQYCLGKHWKLTEKQREACRQRITPEQIEALRERSIGNQYGIGHSYIRTPEQNEANSQMMKNKKNALGCHHTPEQNEAQSKRLMGNTNVTEYWAKVKSGEIIRNPNKKGETKCQKESKI